MEQRIYMMADRIHSYNSEHVSKPCWKIGFCPYGGLVEYFPLHPEHKGKDLNKLANEGKLDTGYNCKVFGHDCPVFYLGEFLSEEYWLEGIESFYKKKEG